MGLPPGEIVLWSLTISTSGSPFFKVQSTNILSISHLREPSEIIKGCCSLDGDLHISDLVLYEEVLEVDREVEGLIEFSKYNRRQRQQILQVLNSHFSQPNVTSDQEIEDLRGLYSDPNIRPDDRDASLIVVACHLGADGQPTIVLTSDPDFTEPIKSLIRQEAISLGEMILPTNRVKYRDYFAFLRQLHDCCRLSTTRYEPLAKAYYAAIVTRLPTLTRPEVSKRDMKILMDMWEIHTASIQFKSTNL